MTAATKRRVTIALFITGMVIVGLLYFVFDPGVSRLAPKCVFHAVTGLECPGCGSQRMIHALLHGDLAGAWKANAFLLCAMPVLALVAFSASFRTRLPRLYAVVNSVPSIICISVAIFLWTLGRNLL